MVRKDNMAKINRRKIAAFGCIIAGMATHLIWGIETYLDEIGIAMLQIGC